MTAAIAAGILIEALLLEHTGLKVVGPGPLAIYAAWSVGAVAVCYGFRNPVSETQRIIRDLVEGVSLFGVVSLLGAIATYPLAAGHAPFADPGLERIDQLLHFDWVGWYELVANHPLIQAIERPVYEAIFLTPAIIIAYMAWTGRRAEIRLFVATFAVAEFTTLVLFPFFPAVGPLATLWHGPLPYMPLSELYQDQVLHALRDHQLNVVDLGALHGLVCAPSFHAASAAVYMATAWKVRPLRTPLVLLNIAMLLATPVEGTHYLADLLSGALVATFAIMVTPALVRLTVPAQARRSVSFKSRLALGTE